MLSKLLSSVAVLKRTAKSIFDLISVPQAEFRQPALTSQLYQTRNSVLASTLAYKSAPRPANLFLQESVHLSKVTFDSIFDVFDKPIYKPRKSFKFTYAASGMPKAPSKKLVNDGALLSAQVGDDSFFCRVDSIGVADGVGGWCNVRGAKPDLYARKLMHYTSLELAKFDDLEDQTYSNEDYYNLDPRNVLTASFNQTEIDATKEQFFGSTTALISVLRDQELRIAHLGDCALLVIRNGEIIFRTEEQQHGFNFPFQLGTQSSDKPSDAVVFNVPVYEGDIVVTGTDGLFDNLFDEDILEIVTRALDGRKSLSIDPKIITDQLLRRAREIAEDSRTATSPFQTRAVQEGRYYRGGKMDDITIVVGVVK